MKVLSLFDGMSCGMIALVVGEYNVERYVAFENETKYATKTASHNFPVIEQRGDVFDADFTEFEGFDLLCGGSPCTYWSIAQTKNRETVASGMGWELFSQYLRALHEAQPMYFIYENNKSMSKAIRASIDEAFGFEAICINSALVSAQNRQRLYWVGKRNPDGTYSKVNVEQPEDRGILLKDVLDAGFSWKDKQNTIDANYYKGGNASGFKRQSGERLCVAEPVASTVLNINPSGNGMNGAVGRVDAKSRCLTTNKGEGPKIIVPVLEPVCVAERGRYTPNGIEQRYEARQDEKTNTLTTVQKDNNVCGPVCMRYERSAEAKAVRKQYEAGEIHHGYHELHELHPRTDGKSNTLSTVLKDNPICEPVVINTTADGKAQCIRATCYKDGIRNIVANDVDKKTGVAEPVEFDGDTPTKAMSCADGKEYTVYEVKDGFITIKEKNYPIKLQDGFYIIRKLTVTECKRLQTVPEWYEFPVSDSQAYKMLGNGWTVQVIVHILSFMDF